MSTPTQFVYKRRSHAAWRRAAAGPKPLNPEDAKWLGELLRAASAADARLDPWESRFIEEFAQRHAQWGERVYVSSRQRQVLDEIAARLGLR